MKPEPDRLRTTLQQLALPDETALWNRLVWSSLISRLEELVDLWQDCLALERRIASPRTSPRWKPLLRHRPVLGREPHHDRGLIAFVVGSTILATFLAGLLWIWSGWPGGANAVAFVAISCCFFGSLDRPAPLIKTMLIWSLVAYVLSGIYIFTVLPLINDFTLLALTLAPPFLLVGAFIPNQSLSLVTLLLAANVAGDLGLQGRWSADFSSFVDGGIAITIGLVFTLAWTLITRPFGVELAARRLVRSGWADLAKLADGSRSLDRAALTSRTLDRLAQLMPRLALNTTSPLPAIDGLAELRAGFNIIALQRDRRVLPTHARERLDATLRGVAPILRWLHPKG